MRQVLSSAHATETTESPDHTETSYGQRRPRSSPGSEGVFFYLHDTETDAQLCSRSRWIVCLSIMPLG